MLVAVFVAVVLLFGVQPVASSSFDTDDEEATATPDDAPLVFDVQSESGETGGDGSLLIDAGEGVPIDARVTFGDPSAPIERPAFTVTNADDRVHDLALAYGGTEGDGPAENVRFLVHDGDGNRVAALSEEDGRVVVRGVASGETLSVVVVVDAHGLTPAADLSGTFSATV